MQTIGFIIFSGFLMVGQIFLSTQVRWSVFINNKLVYTSCLTSCLLVNWKIYMPNVYRIIAYSSSQNENFVSTSKNLLKNRNWTFAVVPYFTWKLELVSNIFWMIVGILTWIWMVSYQLQLILGRFWLITCGFVSGGDRCFRVSVDVFVLMVLDGCE